MDTLPAPETPFFSAVRRAAICERSMKVSLGCSLLLHLFVLFLPVFGIVATFSQPGTQSIQKARPPLAVTFVAPQEVRIPDQQPAPDKHQPQELPAPKPEPDPKPEPEPKVIPDVPSSPDGGRMDKTDLLPLPGVIYYPTSFLTVRPQPLTAADLDPPHIRRIVASGKVILTLWINPSGQTVKVVVNHSDLPPNFVDTAIAAFQLLRFKPGELHAQKVGAVMKVEVTYDDGRLLNMEVLQ